MEHTHMSGQCSRRLPRPYQFAQRAEYQRIEKIVVVLGLNADFPSKATGINSSTSAIRRTRPSGVPSNAPTFDSSPAIPQGNLNTPSAKLYRQHSQYKLLAPNMGLARIPGSRRSYSMVWDYNSLIVDILRS